MKKTLIYPYTKAADFILKNQEMLHDYKITSLVSPSGWGYRGMKIKNGEDTLIVSSDFQSEIDKCSTVVFVDDDIVVLSDDIFREKLKYAKDNNKEIIYLRKND